ncbi:peptide ABC transporter substrate-binding protein [Bdellovibrio sp. HCB209]|uniref:peptide ABC transporter substrate-binding protein n=1 Tax=Bdellovibrio sp. HCB209 TaxID=3394354 RepID=UPI0039B5C120
MKRILLALLIFVSVSYYPDAQGADSKSAPFVFRLHLSGEPNQMDPNRQKTSASSYLLANLFRNIYIYDNEKGLVSDLGSCSRDKSQNLVCKLKKDLQWSDGSLLTSADFLRTYKKMLNPKVTAPRADLLFKVKNAEDIYKGLKQPDTLGITTPDPLTVRFEFQGKAPDFEYNLASFLLAPTKEDIKVYSGPYKIKEWLQGQKIVLEPNLKYQGGHPQRPQVEFLFIEEDTVALQLYEKNQLQLLRRLPTLFIPKSKTREDFHWIPVVRFDYLGFGPELRNNEDLRKALTYSLNYSELQKLFSAKGRPGCAGLPDSWFPEKAPCFDFDLKKVPKVKTDKTYTLMFSSLGGEDHKRATEWMQSQWSKNAGLKLHLEMKENKVYLSELQTNPPAIFRKGVATDRPTCLAALEIFASHSPENYIQLKNSEYDQILTQLGNATKASEQKKLCHIGVKFLMDRHLIIPMGAFDFAMLIKPDFVGWKINQMNQLDLSQLHSRP